MNKYEISYEHAIYGKVHGQATDYRWIASSPDFQGIERKIEHKVRLGAEDKAANTTLWYVTDESFYAVFCYPSRAVDATGRSGGVEKQFFEIKRNGNKISARIIAMMLLPEIATLTDNFWWQYASDEAWSNPSYKLTLKSGKKSFSTNNLRDCIKKAEDKMVSFFSYDNTNKDNIKAPFVELYARILAGEKRVFLKKMDCAIPPDLLALLLFPFSDPQKVNQLCLASWMPTSRIDWQTPEIMKWDMLVLPNHLRPPENHTPYISSECKEKGKKMVNILFSGKIAEHLNAKRKKEEQKKNEVAAIIPQQLDEKKTASRVTIHIPGEKLDIENSGQHQDKNSLTERLHDYITHVDQRSPLPVLKLIENNSFTQEDKKDFISQKDHWLQSLRSNKPDYVDQAQWDIKTLLINYIVENIDPSKKELKSRDFREYINKNQALLNSDANQLMHC